MPGSRVPQSSHRPPRRAAGLAVALALLLIASSPAQAYVLRGTSTYQDPGRVWMTMGLWGGWASFGAQWKIEQTRDAGRTWQATGFTDRPQHSLSVVAFATENVGWALRRASDGPIVDGAIEPGVIVRAGNL